MLFASAAIVNSNITCSREMGDRVADRERICEAVAR